MPWFKVDDKLHDHRKSRKAKKAAMGVWVLAGSWCMDNLTDGFIPVDVLTRWGTPADARALVAADLWIEATRDGEKGWQFHDWDRFQPSAAVTAATKAAEAEAGVRGNHKRWHAQRGITDPDCEYCYRVPDQEPDWVPEAQPESGPDSPPIRPEPQPIPNTKAKAFAAPTNAQELVGEWIEHCTERPPKAVIGQVSKNLKAMLDEGIRIEAVRAGLAGWAKKGLHPSALPSVVHEVQTKNGATRDLPDGSHIDADGIRYLADGSVDESSLPPVEQSWMKRRPR